MIQSDHRSDDTADGRDNDDEPSTRNYKPNEFSLLNVSEKFEGKLTTDGVSVCENSRKFFLKFFIVTGKRKKNYKKRLA